MASVSSGRRANNSRASLRVDVHIYYLKKGSNSRKKLRVRGFVDIDVAMATRIDRESGVQAERGALQLVYLTTQIDSKIDRERERGGEGGATLITYAHPKIIAARSRKLFRGFHVD